MSVVSALSLDALIIHPSSPTNCLNYI